MMTDSRYFLVKLEPGLPQHRTTGLFHAIRLHPGVEMVCDLSAISQATLDVILRKPTPAVQREEPTIYNAIRRYHQRKRQPELPLVGEPAPPKRQRKTRSAA